MSSQLKKQAFTLIEISIVIGILCLLAAIIFPVLSRVHEKGRQTTCQSNLRQLGLALQQYAADNNSVLPSWWGTTYNPNSRDRDETIPAGGICWTNQMLPYFKSWDLVHCPSASKDRLSHKELDAIDLVGIPTGRPDYHFNANLSALNETRILVPAKVVTFGESTAESAYMYVSSPWGPGRVGQGGDRHFGGANWAFYDGHIKWLNDTSAELRGGGTSNIKIGYNPEYNLSYCPY